MQVNTTKQITVTAEEIEQALARWLNQQGYPGVMQVETTFQFNIRGASLDTAYDTGQVLDGCTVTVKEQ